jgi:hypothetical protein
MLAVTFVCQGRSQELAQDQASEERHASLYGLKYLADSWRHVYRQVGFVKPGKQCAQPSGSAAAYNRCGCMYGWTTYGRPEHTKLLFGNHNRVEPVSVEVGVKAPRFPNGITYACKLIRMILHQVLGPETPANLLITQDG